MFEVVAALCKPLQNIVLEREALLFHMNEGKLCEAIISEVLTDHTVKEIVYHLRFAVQFIDFKAMNRLSLISTVKFFLEYFKCPRYLIRNSL